MTTPMTPERLAEIKAMAEAASDGDWVSEGGHIVRYGGTGIDHDKATGEPIGPCQLAPHLLATTELEEDAMFLATARAAIPELIAEVERLKTELQNAENKIDQFEWDNAYG